MDCSTATAPRVIEFFAGIGGLAAAWPAAKVVAAIDINRIAEETYRHNHPHPFFVREIESLAVEYLLRFEASCWWLSPPCQPYTRRGNGRDIHDPRARPLLHLIQTIRQCRPRALALENVIGFADSLACEQLLQTLDACGYHVRTIELCPSQMRWPNRRPRFYLLASQQALPKWKPLPTCAAVLQDFLLPHSRADSGYLWLSDLLVEKYFDALDRVEPDDEHAVTACFAASYGKAVLRSGSYLNSEGGYRRFSPREVGRLMGFSDSFELGHLTPRRAWKLLGNSLSLPAVRYVTSHLTN